ncbi:hypothetical protein, partial [Treponema sp. R8-4-B8]
MSRFIFLSPFINSLSHVEFIQKNPNIYYSDIFLSNVVIAVCCLFAARWLRETKLKPPIPLYVIFNLLFILFPLVILAWYENILNVMSISFLTSAFISSFFLVIMLFLFYLYTRLTTNNLTAGLNAAENSLSLKTEKAEKCTPFIQL